MITKYDPKIYPLKLYVAVGDDQWGKIYRKFTKLNHDPIDTSKDEIKRCNGMTIFVREKKYKPFRCTYLVIQRWYRGENCCS